MASGNSQITNVIPLDRHIRPLRAPAIAVVEAYWHALNADGTIPKRSCVDPRGIACALARTFIAEQIAPGIARLRIAGSALSDLLGMEVRGMPLTALFSADARPAISALMADVLAGATPRRIPICSKASMGRPKLDGQLLLAPLRDDFGQVNRLLGVIDVCGTLGRTPRRFDVDPVTGAHAHRECAEARTPFIAAPKPDTKCPHLSLVPRP